MSNFSMISFVGRVKFDIMKTSKVSIQGPKRPK